MAPEVGGNVPMDGSGQANPEGSKVLRGRRINKKIMSVCMCINGSAKNID